MRSLSSARSKKPTPRESSNTTMGTPETYPSAILKNTYTLYALYKRLDLLQRFFEHYFFEGEATAGRRAQLLQEYYRDADADLRFHIGAIAAWDGEVLDSFTAQNLYDRLQVLKQSAKELPVVTLYVPTHLTSEQLGPIGIWCRAYVHTSIMLDMRVDPSSVGGCTLVYNNVFHDFSLSYFVSKQRSELVKLVHEYGG